ncbi:MAG: hypothetical protein AAFR58_13030 [Cyanobacteria bacterium J06627_28]
MTDSARAALETLQLKPVLGKRTPLGERAARGIVQPSASQPLGRFTPSPFQSLLSSDPSLLAGIPLAARFVGLPAELGNASAFQNFVPEGETSPELPAEKGAEVPATLLKKLSPIQTEDLSTVQPKQQSEDSPTLSLLNTPSQTSLSIPPPPTASPQASPFNDLPLLVQRRPLGHAFEPAAYRALPVGDAVDEGGSDAQDIRSPSPSFEPQGLAIQSREDFGAWGVPRLPSTTDEGEDNIHRRLATSTDNLPDSDVVSGSVSSEVRRTPKTLVNPAIVTEPSVEEQSLPAVLLPPTPTIAPKVESASAPTSNSLAEATPQTTPDLAAKAENSQPVSTVQPPEGISLVDSQTEVKETFYTAPEIQSKAFTHEETQVIDAEKETQTAPTIQPQAIVQADAPAAVNLNPDASTEVAPSVDRDIQSKDLSGIKPKTVAETASKAPTIKGIDTFSPAPVVPDSIVSPVEPAAYSALTPLNDGLKIGQSKLATAPLGRHIPLAEAPSVKRINRTPSVDSDIKHRSVVDDALMSNASIDEISTIDAPSHSDVRESGEPAGEPETTPIQHRLSELSQKSPEVATSDAPIMRAPNATALAQTLDTQAEPWFDSSSVDQNLSTENEPWQTQFSLDPVEARADPSSDPATATATDFSATSVTTLVSPLAQPASADVSLSKDTQPIQVKSPDRANAQNEEELLEALAKVLYGELRASLARRYETELGRAYYLGSWQMLPTHQELWPPELHQLSSAVKCQVESRLRCDRERTHYDPPLLIAR